MYSPMVIQGTANTPKDGFAKVLIDPSVMANMSSQWSVKRVPLDFYWPVGYLWHGYMNPWPGPIECEDCGGTGLNSECQKLFRNFRRWAPRLTEQEVELATQAGVSSEEITQILNRVWGEVDTQLIRSYLTEIRAKTTGIWGLCTVCKGKKRVVNPNPAVQQLYTDVDLFEEWRPIEPPKGDGWQLWQVRADGGYPQSAVYKSDEQLAKWCSVHFKSDYAGWLKWIIREGSKVPQDPPEFRLKSENITVFHQQPVSKA